MTHEQLGPPAGEKAGMSSVARAKDDHHICAQLIANVASRFGFEAWMVHTIPIGTVYRMLQQSLVAVPAASIDVLCDVLASPFPITPGIAVEQAASLLQGKLVVAGPGRFRRLGERPSHVPESVWSAETEGELRMAMWIEANKNHPSEALAAAPATAADGDDGTERGG